jgi:tape measure domain-containing protein
MNILPPNAQADISSTNDRISELGNRLTELQNMDISVMDAGAVERYNSEVESLRSGLNGIVNIQERMNQAMEEGDVTSLNQGFIQLNSSTQSLEQRVRANMTAIQEMNNIQWTTPQSMEIFNTSGIERYRSEVQSANSMLNQLQTQQQQITAQALSMNILPPNAQADFVRIDSRIQGLKSQLQKLQESGHLELGADRAAAQMESLRSQIMNAQRAQNDLNSAMERMDVSGANDAYNRLNSIIDSTQQNIRDNVNEQENFNQKMKGGHSLADDLKGKIMGMAAAYMSIRGVGMVLGLSDELTQTTARLNMINDGMQTTKELQDKIFLSAQRAGASYQMTSDVVAKLGLQAGKAFGSNDELIAFSEQLNKSFSIAGTSASGVESVMYNLTQALSSGVLRGQDLNSVFSNAPNIIQNIADYLDVDIGKIREMAADGQLSADVVKNAMLAAAEQTNAKFAEMPLTMAQIGQKIKNNAIKAFEPILAKINQIANSPEFQAFVDNATNAIVQVAGIVTEIFDVIMSVASWVADAWNTLAPIIAIATGALLAYKAVMIATQVAEAIATAAKYAYVFVVSIFNAATAAATAAQWSLNAAMYANPIGIVIALVIALALAFIFFTEQIMGALFWAGALFKNIGLWLANVGIAAWNVIKNIGLWFANLGLAIWAGIQNVGAWFGNLGMGIWEVLKACASNVMAAFQNAWINIQIGFNSFVSTILKGVKQIIDWLNLIPGVNINTGGIESSITGYANKMAELEASKHEYTDIGDAWAKGNSTFDYKDVGDAWNTNEIDWGKVGEGFNTFDTFEKGWGSEAYNSGAEVGAGIHDKLMSLIPDFSGGGSGNIPQADAFGEFDPAAIGAGVNDIAGNTGAMRNSMSASEEDLKYLHDIAERETINRFTTAEVHFEMGGVTNNVNSEMDLDGIADYIGDAMMERLEIVAEGVYA